MPPATLLKLLKSESHLSVKSSSSQLYNKRFPFRLRRSNVQVKFVTNTTKECRAFLYERLINLGFELAIDEIISSLTATRNMLARENLRPLLLVDSKALAEFSDLPSDENYDSVVIGLAPEHFHYETLNKAFR